MGNEVSNVTVAKPAVGGAVYVAPLGTPIPTTADGDIDPAFKCLGYISEEGIKNSAEKSSDDVKAWGGDVVASPQTEFSDKFSMKFIEALNPDVQKTVRGSYNVTGNLETGMSVKINSKENERLRWIIDMMATGDVLFRTVIPDAKITEIGDVEYVDGKPVGYETTLKAFPDSGGDYHHEYFKKKETP